MNKIFIATHKKSTFPKEKIYIPIQVGAAKNQNLGILADNLGRNISDQNSNFCELTALYYIWKNEEDYDTIGLCHYRRYFFKNIFKRNILENVLEAEEIDNIMKKYDIILPEPLALGKLTVKEQYAKFHNVSDFERCREIIQLKHKEYLEAFDNVSNRHYLYAYNMFIMKKQEFYDYMEWVFDILFELQKQINIDLYDDYNKRVYGFLSERLFNVWLDKNNFNIKTVPVFNTESKYSVELKSFISNKVKVLAYKKGSNKY